MRSEDNNSTPPASAGKSVAKRSKPTWLDLAVLGVVVLAGLGMLLTLASAMQFMTGHKREFARERHLLEHGQPVLVEVLSIRETGGSWNEKPIVEIDLEVRPLDAPAFTLQVTKVLAFTDIIKYVEGSLIEARYDPAEPDTVVFIGVAQPIQAESPE